jgi:hypothetical protein
MENYEGYSLNTENNIIYMWRAISVNMSTVRKMFVDMTGESVVPSPYGRG